MRGKEFQIGKVDIVLIVIQIQTNNNPKNYRIKNNHIKGLSRVKVHIVLQ